MKTKKKKYSAEDALGKDLSEAISNEHLLVHSISGNSVEARLEFEIHAADGTIWIPKNDCRRIALRKLR